ncbi:hypothetical protein [Streptomyces sp. NPDC053367]|uniref:hypothetical protein n=1 Tax=Streptomyces sp. NPDC053367 TaxID=3365700 RepID=UPI0037D1C664
MFGQVKAIGDKKPIFMIKGSVRGDLSLIDRDYAHEEGRYEVEVPAGELVTAGFERAPLRLGTRRRGRTLPWLFRVLI